MRVGLRDCDADGVGACEFDDVSEEVVDTDAVRDCDADAVPDGVGVPEGDLDGVRVNVWDRDWVCEAVPVAVVLSV